MALIPWISVLLLLKGSHSYILLTANLDDVHAIAKQIAHSPVADQLNSILRRASNIFNQQLRARGDDVYQHRSSRFDPQVPDTLGSIQDNRIERRSQTEQALHTTLHHHHRRSGVNESQNNHQRRSRSESNANVPEKRNKESKTAKEIQDQLETTTLSNEHKEPSDHHVESKEFTRGDSEEKSNVNENQLREHHHAKESSQNDEVPRQKNETPWSHTDEVVALGKNASFYLNSIKKIIENV